MFSEESGHMVEKKKQRRSAAGCAATTKVGAFHVNAAPNPPTSTTTTTGDHHPDHHGRITEEDGRDDNEDDGEGYSASSLVERRMEIKARNNNNATLLFGDDDTSPPDVVDKDDDDRDNDEATALPPAEEESSGHHQQSELPRSMNDPSHQSDDSHSTTTFPSLILNEKMAIKARRLGLLSQQAVGTTTSCAHSGRSPPPPIVGPPPAEESSARRHQSGAFHNSSPSLMEKKIAIKSQRLGRALLSSGEEDEKLVTTADGTSENPSPKASTTHWEDGNEWDVECPSSDAAEAATAKTTTTTIPLETEVGNHNTFTTPRHDDSCLIEAHVVEEEDDQQPLHTAEAISEVSLKRKRRLQWLCSVAAFTIIIVVVVTVALSSKEEAALSEYDSLKNILEPVSGSAALFNETTPQHKAFQWLAFEDPAKLSAAASTTNSQVLIDRYVLALFYFATGGPTWSRDLSFLTNLSVCDWNFRAGEAADTSTVNGVECNNVGTVSEIRLGMCWTLAYY